MMYLFNLPSTVVYNMVSICVFRSYFYSLAQVGKKTM